MDNEPASIGSILLLLTVFLAYFIPAVIASLRHHHQANAITWLNLLTGWSGIGWLAAFIWSLTAVRPELNREQTKACPHCAERIMRDAVICKHCGRQVVVKKMADPQMTKPAPTSPRGSRKERELAAEYGIEQEDGYCLYKGKRYSSIAIALKFAQAAETNK